MPLAPELTVYDSEDDFTQRFLIPLLRRLGFSVVANYHGTSEFGKDLIFAEIDRLGHIRYHGLQSKYVSGVTLKASQELIDDAKQAFENPFVHPHTKETHSISTFYAANGGTISEEGRMHFFNSLRQYAGNIRLLDGKSLVDLDRWGAYRSGDSLGPQLTGLLHEIHRNRYILVASGGLLDEWLADINKPLPIERLTDDATRSYLIRPLPQDMLGESEIRQDAEFIRFYNSALDFGTMSLAAPENKHSIVRRMLQQRDSFCARQTLAEMRIIEILGSLGPIAGL